VKGFQISLLFVKKLADRRFALARQRAERPVKFIDPTGMLLLAQQYVAKMIV
jgi:hypothetical protein